MKRLKNYLYLGIVYLLVGITFLAIELKFQTKSEGILYGLAFVGFLYGGLCLFKYFYWSKPENKEEYNQKTEERNIELEDERKTILRDKAGRRTYNIGLSVTSAALILLTIVHSFHRVANYNLMVLYLAIYMISQYIIGVLIYNSLNNKN